MKTKEEVARTYDKDGYKLRAGCLCYKDESEKEILLVTSSRYHDRWVVPAGGIDPGETPCDAAVREVFEEAGVKGSVGAFLGIFQNDKRKSRTYVYSMVVKDMLKPIECKERKWFIVKDALFMLNHRPVQQTYITTAIDKKVSNTVLTSSQKKVLGNLLG
ncbi:diphosphoinositol polyphosphate phosphohydrolase 1-like [Hydractinia symbiolongicarpus]|uniref:diphosphoinositol polyphosphate phosphohydrolase 1-like n=1 Tax=Hydractinia symbiolongicarpus TaxID=13093 RepID=UPI00254ED29A|nr:diphosphoinositol polyphosphate phosphohydrolase 1-like [Hydractinia symbiolongicarpus]XP_057307991.1 diphosphoinositol polyphosphate phosphohydrolase 1-like [Hydractinia symbiolongicarpus]